MTQPNDTAFGINEYRPNNPGLTKREYFAAMAMQGLAAINEPSWSLEDRAAEAVHSADALINALNK